MGDQTGGPAAWPEAVASLSAEPDFNKHWAAYQKAFEGWDAKLGPPPAWLPDGRRIASSNLERLRLDLGLLSYQDLHKWTTANRGQFWRKVLSDFGVNLGPTDFAGDAEKPNWFPGTRLNVAELALHADQHRPAIIWASEDAANLQSWTMAQLNDKARRVAAGLIASGFKRGDAIALYMPMTARCVAVYLGIVLAGMTVVSIPDSFAPQEVATRLRLGNAKGLFSVQEFLRAGKPVAMANKAQDAIALLDTPVKLLLCQGAREGAICWDQLLDHEPLTDAIQCDPYDVSNILFSSGTTGEPKAIPWTQLTPFKAAMDGKYHQDIHAGDVVCWPTNIGWMMGPWLVYASLLNGATIALFEGAPTGDRFLKFVNEAQVSMLGVVPAIVRAWRSSGTTPGALPGIKTFSSTGEASNVEDYLWLMSLANYQAPVIEYCGGTEIGGGHITGTVVQPQSPATFSTPTLGLDFVVLNDQGDEANPGELGEIFLLPPSVGLSESLLNRDHHQAYYAELPPYSGDQLRRHGDQMEVLHGGYWAAQGRADDTMNLGGIKVASVELERVAATVTGIQEVAAIATRPKSGGADQLVLFVVGHGQPEALQAEAQAQIKAHLNPLFRIHDLQLVASLPRTASNKVMRRVLRDQYEAQS